MAPKEGTPPNTYFQCGQMNTNGKWRGKVLLEGKAGTLEEGTWWVVSESRTGLLELSHFTARAGSPGILTIQILTIHVS